MKEHLELDPLDELRAANPVSPDRLSSASLARIRARVREETMATTPATRTSAWPGLAGLGAALAAAGALAIVLIVGGGRSGPGAAPGTGPGSSAGTGSAACVEQYSAATLVNRTFAFDGTVTAVEGDLVTFTVNRGYRGADGGTITLEAAGMTGTTITSAGGPTLSVGQRYLVAGDDRFVWGCGFTQPWDAAVAKHWVAAFGG